MYIIPGHAKHRAVAIDGPVVAMDVFSPIREDYLDSSPGNLMNPGANK
jgi:hypothetical protein